MTTIETGRSPSPCDPTTLTACCVDCGQPMHVGRRRNMPRGRCDQGHPRHAARGQCRRCNQREVARGRATRRGPELPPVPDPDTAWQRHAACRDTDDYRFIPDIQAGIRGGFRLATEDLARRYCDPCPVRQACSDYADQTRSVGLWGGVWRRWHGTTYRRDAVTPTAHPTPMPGGRPKRRAS
jgi:WhiB family transcriptional regulator, redox-sensing transcriptional regulator